MWHDWRYEAKAKGLRITPTLCFYSAPLVQLASWVLHSGYSRREVLSQLQHFSVVYRYAILIRSSCLTHLSSSWSKCNPMLAFVFLEFCVYAFHKLAHYSILQPSSCNAVPKVPGAAPILDWTSTNFQPRLLHLSQTPSHAPRSRMRTW